MKNFTLLCWDRLPAPGGHLPILTGRPRRADVPSRSLTRAKHLSGCRRPGSELCSSGAASH
eukprot:15009404-Alexandrium_andersonii.AAC.1